MSQMSKIMGAILKSLSKGSEKLEDSSSLGSKLNLNQEYKEAFRTKSYVEMCTKAQFQLTTTSLTASASPSPSASPSASASASASASTPFSTTNLAGTLLEPRQDILADMIENLDFHGLVIDYFEASLTACSICELLIQSIRQVDSKYIKYMKRVANFGQRLSKHEQDYDCSIVFQDFARLALLENPLSVVKFGEIHEANTLLLDKLTLKRKKITKKEKFMRCCRKIRDCSLVVSCSALLTTVLVVAIHSVVGIIAAPGIVAVSLLFLRKKFGQSPNKSILDKLSGQLDVAAKGIFIFLNDFDTLSRLVRRLHDEIEHGKYVAELCVKNRKYKVLSEAVREFQVQEPRFLEQLQELEEHVYLCFHTINRSRRLVLEEILVTQV